MQSQATFQSPLPLRLELSNGENRTIHTRLKNTDTLLSSVLPSRPLSVEIDPDATVLRRMRREELPPVLNHYVTDGHRSVIQALGISADSSHPLQEVIRRLEAQDGQKPVSQRTTIIPLVQDLLLPPEGSVLVLSAPASRAALQPALKEHCASRVQLRDGGVTIEGKSYDGQGIAALVNCHRRDRPGSVVTWVYAVSPQAATTVARLLFFYGWHSVVVFQDGKAIARSEWDAPQTRMEVSIDEGVPNR